MKQVIRPQSGLTYVEVLVATAIIVAALVPAIDALYAGMLGSEVYQSSTQEHYAAQAKMETVLAEPFAALTSSAAVAGDRLTPSSYSDLAGSTNRALVFLGLYDGGNNDADGDEFTVADPNLDGDNDVFTGYAGLLWVSVEIEGSITNLESLSAP